MEPEYLYRATSDESQGINDSTFFTPKAAMKWADPSTYIAREDSGNEIVELEAALAWKHTVDRYIFWTSSLPFAIGLATFRKFDGEKNIKITCIRVDQTRTPAGTKARFRSVDEILSVHGHPGFRNKDGSPREYSDVFVTTDCFKTGRGTWISEFKSLELNGIYDLYPALQVNSFRNRPRLHLLLQDARAYGFKEVVALTPGRIGTAAALASTFKIVTAHSSCLPIHVLGSLLAFQKRASGDQSLKVWLERYSDPVIDLDGDDSNDEDDSQQLKNSTMLPEVRQYHELMRLLGCHRVETIFATHSMKMTKAEIHEEIQAWRAWKKQDIDHRRASRPDREQTGRKKSYRRTNKRSRDDGRIDFHARNPNPGSVVELDDTDDEIGKLVDTDGEDEVVESTSAPASDSFSRQHRASYEDRRNNRFIKGRREYRDREYSSRRRDGFDSSRSKRRRY